MFGDEEILIETAFRTFRVRVDRFADQRPTEAQLDDGRSLALELRFGLSYFEPGALVAAQRLFHALRNVGPFRPRRADAKPETRRFFDQLGDFLEGQFEAGRLVVTAEPAIGNVPEQELGVRRPPIDASPPDLPLSPRPAPPLETSFEVRFVDEIGQAISGLEVQIAAGDRSEPVKTNAAGVALLEGTTAGSGTVTVLDAAALEKIVEPRWAKARIGNAPSGPNTARRQFSGEELDVVDIKAGVPNTVVITPVLGAIFLELRDRSSSVLHAKRDYTISGPLSLEGTTDEAGRLRHEGVPNGEYTLSLTLVHFEGDPDEVTDTLQGPVVVVDGVDSLPQARLLGAVPRSILAELHMFFNTNKAFLLPSVFPSIQKLRDLYAQNAPGQLLVVGHADTKGTSEYNDKLSLERAKATVAFLKDDVDGWLKFYGADIESQKRWGKVEDHLMCTAMPDFVSKGSRENAIKWYQRTRGLTVDGTAGSDTRRALIEEYMSLDGTSLEAVEEMTVTAHGCGENFPLDDSGENLDAAPQDEKRDPIDRRVELFFFDNEFGITPPPPGENSVAGSKEYPTWRQRVAQVVSLRADDVDGPEVIFVELADVHFRTNSAVVLPEGQNPVAAGEQQTFTAAGVIASALRFNEGHPGRSLLVAGHTDTTADIDFNQKLSEERANVALALLKGGDDSRDQFGKLCNGRHTVSDIKQILAWVSTAFSSVTFTCDPGVVDDNGATLNEPVRRFQGDFNRNKQALGSSADDLKIDGSVGEATWGAFFDCYEFSLQQELGETANGVATLRTRLEFTDPDHEALGFSEYFPIEELGVDDFRSQANRRVEFLFFEPDEVPNIDHAVDDPETSELYLPGYYERLPLPPLSDVKTHTFNFRVHDVSRKFMPGAACTLTVLDQVSSLTADSQGIVSFTLPPVCPESVLLAWTDGTNNFSQKLFVECTDGPIESVAPARLENLGYPAFADIELAVAIFQRDYGLLPPEPLGPNQELPQGVLQELQSIWDVRLCDAGLPPAAGGGE